MIAVLRGQILRKMPNYVIIDVGGVGYQVFVPALTMGRLPPTGSTACLDIHTQVREDGITLFGFLSEREKQLFEHLISVSGIGPRLGLAILSSLSPERLESALVSSDVFALTAIPGVGKKIAERLVLELREKIPVAAGLAAALSLPDEAGEAGSDAVNALVALGYTKFESLEAVRKLMSEAEEPVDTESLVRGALRLVAGLRSTVTR